MARQPRLDATGEERVLRLEHNARGEGTRLCEWRAALAHRSTHAERGADVCTFSSKQSRREKVARHARGRGGDSRSVRAAEEGSRTRGEVGPGRDVVVVLASFAEGCEFVGVQKQKARPERRRVAGEEDEKEEECRRRARGELFPRLDHRYGISYCKIERTL